MAGGCHEVIRFTYPAGLELELSTAYKIEISGCKSFRYHAYCEYIH